MQKNDPTAVNDHQERLRTVIAGFIRQLHEANGPSVTHVTVTVHGELKHFAKDRSIHAIPVKKMHRITTLNYQEMVVEGPIPNMITVIATDNAPAD